MRILSILRPGRSTKDIDSIGAMSLPINLSYLLRDHDIITDFMTDAILEGCVTYPFSPEMTLRDIVKEAFMIYRENNYDILHFQLFNFSYTSHIASQISDSDNVVVTLHLPPVGLSAYAILDQLKYLSDLPNVRLVSVSESGVKSLLDDKGITSYTVHNGVIDKPQYFKSLDSKEFRGVIIGRMEQSKNILEGLNYFVSRGIPCTYIGTDPQSNCKDYGNACRNFLEEHDDIITHIERASNSEVREVLGNSLFNLSLSSLESFGLTLVESNLVGTPNIYLEIPGVKDTQCTGTTGCRIPPDRAYRKRWVTKYQLIDECLESIKSLDSQVMRDYALSRFSMDICAKNYIKIYKEVIK